MKAGVRSALFAAGVVVFAACGGGGMTLTEYATGAEELVATMEADFVALDAAWESRSPTKEGALEYWAGRLGIRDDFLEGVEDLDPPGEVEGMHATSIDIFKRITAADQAIADWVADQATVSEHWAWVDTPEGRASDAILAEVFEFCRYAQGRFDATQSRGALADIPWVPSAMTEVVSVAFGCPP